MMLSFLVNLKGYSHKHDIENFFYIHSYDTILHSLQEMVQIQLDETCDSSLITHYFVHQQEDIKLVHNIWYIYALNIACGRAHLMHEM